MALDILRRCIFQPYSKGAGPRFELRMWATTRTDKRGQTVIGYRLRELSWGAKGAVCRDLFEAEDFAGSPLHADDSDATVAALMGFLTLKPGDTDADYFTNDTEDQKRFRYLHASDLAHAVYSRFGCDS